MQIFLKTLNGKTLTLIVKPSDLILDFKKQVEDRQGIPWIIQRVDYGGKLLDNDLTFSFYNIKKESTLFLTMPINNHIIIQIDENDYINQCWTRPSNANTYIFDQLKQEIYDTLKIKTSVQDFYKTYCLLPRNNDSVVIDNYLRIWTKEAAELWDENQITLILHLKQRQTLKWYNETKTTLTQSAKQRFSIQIIINNKHSFQDLGKILLTIAMSSNVTISTFIQTAKKKIDKKYSKKYDLSYEEQTGLQMYIRSKKDKDIKQMQAKWYEIIDWDEPIKDYVINNNDEVIVFIFNIDCIEEKEQKEQKEQKEPEPDTMIARVKALKRIKNEDRDKEIQSLFTILSNILKNPFNPKYQSINMREVKQTFTKYPICIELLYDSGFKKTSNGKKLRFNINNMKLLKKTHEALQTTLETDQNDDADSDADSEEKKNNDLTADEKAQLDILKELMKEFKIEITVKSMSGSGDAYNICDVGLLDTVKRLKVSIANVTKVSKSAQRLSWQGRIMNDERLLRDYTGFGENPIVTLMVKETRKMTLTVKPGNFEFDDVDKNTTVLDIKNKISAITNCPFYIQTLEYNGIDLEDETTISEYGIENEDTLDLSVSLISLDDQTHNHMLFVGYLGNGNDNDNDNDNMTVYLKTIEGNIVRIDDICVGDTVEILKQKLFEKKRIPVEKQTLIRRGFIMEDGKRLAEYGIEDQDSEIVVGAQDQDGNITF